LGRRENLALLLLLLMSGKKQKKHVSLERERFVLALRLFFRL